MKQIVADFKTELEQNLNAAASTIKAEPKKFFQSAKVAVTGQLPKSGNNDFGKVLEKAATTAQGSQKIDPLASDKPAPSKKMMGKITDLTAMVAKKRTEEVRKRLEQIRNEAMNKDKDEKPAVIGGDGSGPEIKVGTKKLTPIQQSIKNAETSTESKDVGGIG